MKIVRFKTLAWLLPLLAFLAAGALLRADDPPAPPASPDKQTPPPAPAEQAAPAAQPAAPTEEDNAAQVAVEAAEKARVQAEQALADAEKAAEKARAEAEKARNEARIAAEKAREEAKAAADQANQQVRAAVEEVQKQVSEIKRGKRTRTSNAGDRFILGDDNHVAAGTVVPHDAVAIMGNLTVDGEVMNDAVAVMGDNTINGRVHGNAKAAMGDLILGPKAVIDGDITCVMGELRKDPSAVVHGQTEVETPGFNIRPASLVSWWEHALRLGRPLAIGAHLGWLWIVTAFSVAFYALLGLLFPRKIAACGDKLIDEPFMVALSAMLAVLALPVLFVLLCITVVGIPVALFVLPVGCLLTAMFGKAAIYGLVGRKLTGDRLHPALAVLAGALIFVLFYLIPVVGLLLTLLVWFLGFGCAVLVMFGRAKSAPPVAPAPVSPPPAAPLAAGAVASGSTPTSFAAPASMPAQSSGFGAPSASTEVPPTLPMPSVAEAVPPVYGTATRAAAVPFSAATLPRAGFWIRVAAAFLDTMMIIIPLGISGAMDHGRGPGMMFLAIAAYHAVMWKLKGTTIGGVICNLKVVRLDDREIDWGVAVVRALSAFISLFVAFLGFIWVAFDDEKQSWHDKIAGTTIVRVPKGTSLL